MGKKQFEEYKMPIFVRCWFCCDLQPVISPGSLIPFEKSYPAILVNTIAVQNHFNGKLEIKRIKEEFYLCRKHYKEQQLKDRDG